MSDEYPQSINESFGSNGAPELNPADFTETPEYSGETPMQAPPQESAETRHVLDSMAEKGYDVSGFSSDEDLIKETEARYAASIQQEQELDAQRERLAAERYQEQQEYMQQQQQPQQAEPNTPEYDPQWAQFVEADPATGNYVLRQEYVGSVDPTIAEKVTNFVNHRKDMSEALLNDPVNAVLNAGLGDKIQSQINASIDNAVRKTTLRNQAEQFIDANREVLYVSDPATGRTQTDSNGNPVLSPVGRALNDAHVMLRKNGLTDPVTRHQIATQMVQNHFTQQQLQNMPQQPQQTQQDQYKQEYTQQPFAQPSNPMPPGYMPNTPVQPQANSIGANGLPEHTSLGSLATALAVHKGFLQPK